MRYPTLHIEVRVQRNSLVTTEGLLPVFWNTYVRSRVKSRRYVRRRTYAIKNFVYWFKRVQV